MSEKLDKTISKSIFIVGLDGSQCSEWAFEKALQLLNKNEDKLILLHVLEFNTPSIFDPFHDKIDRLVNLDLEENAKKIKEKYSTICQNKQINFEYVELQGDPRNCMCEYVIQHKPNLLILGSRGLGILGK